MTYEHESYPSRCVQSVLKRYPSRSDLSLANIRIHQGRCNISEPVLHWGCSQKDCDAPVVNHLKLTGFGAPRFSGDHK